MTPCLPSPCPPWLQVVGLDFAADMLQDAARRQQQQRREAPGRRTAPINWVQVSQGLQSSSSQQHLPAAQGYRQQQDEGL